MKEIKFRKYDKIAGQRIEKHVDLPIEQKLFSLRASMIAENDRL